MIERIEKYIRGKHKKQTKSQSNLNAKRTQTNERTVLSSNDKTKQNKKDVFELFYLYPSCRHYGNPFQGVY